MDDLTLIRDLTEDAVLPNAKRLAPARAAFIAEAGLAKKRFWSMGRIAFAGTAGLAAAAIVVVAAAKAPPPAPAPAPPLAMAPTERPLRLASQVLDEAADAALRQEAVVPRPDQFLYLSQRGAGGKVVYEGWFSIDGKHDGLVIRSEEGETVLEACRPGKKTVEGDNCKPEAHYLPDLPTDPKKLLKQIEKDANQDTEEARTNAIAKDLWYYAEQFWLTPKQRAAVYRAAATVPGLKVIEGVTDPAGRKGTGVAWTYGAQAMWIFDPETNVFLGSQTTTTDVALVDAVRDR
ncbi:CU044_5270 family protein [Winogradskya consettensis]|uniref:Uncharacterized protein n=1 Tax=Winogradskya consettensis TaxID=113560 RepID=A0A919VQ62_9ACTN|nr:hypothetical protein Aco04nite_28950 [Actinoplanes consettensis]